MLTQLVVALVVEPLDGGILDGAVHALDLTIGPRVSRLGEPVLDIELGAGELEGVAEEWLLAGQHLLDVLGRPAIAGGLGEVRAVVGEHGVDRVWNRRGERPEEVGRDTAGGLLVQFDKGKLRGAVDGDEKVELALLRPDLSDVDVEVADGVALELGAARLVALGVRQPADAVALEAAVQAGAGEVRQGRLRA